MVLHIGFSPFFGGLSIYDSITKVQTFDRISLVYFNQFDKIPLIFDEIKSKINTTDPKFGCVCILLDHNYKDEFRNILIENCKNFGFKKIEFTTLRNALILDTIFQTNYIPKNGDIIGIIKDSTKCQIFKYGFENVEYLGEWKFKAKNEIEKNDFEEPKIFLFMENENLKIIEFLRKEFSESSFFGFQKYPNSTNGLILKA